MRRVLLDDRRERRLVELAANHGGGLQHVLLARGQAIDARRQEGAHGTRHFELVDRLTSRHPRGPRPPFRPP